MLLAPGRSLGLSRRETIMCSDRGLANTAVNSQQCFEVLVMSSLVVPAAPVSKVPEGRKAVRPYKAL